MTNTPDRMVSVIDVIIPHPSEPRVFVVADGGGVRLPRVPIDNIRSADMEQISHMVRRDLGIATTVLRSAAEQADKARGCVHMIFVLENRDPHWQPPPGGRWAGRAEINGLPPDQRPPVDAHLEEVERRSVPALRTPWSRVGWLDQAAPWIAAQLKALGTPLARPVELVRSWSISCVLRAPTATGATYFKVAADLPLFVNEPLVLDWLARRFPANIPAPLAVDRERRWMLLPDFGPPIGRDGPLAAHLAMLRVFGAIQRDCVEQADELLRLGCHDRRLARLPAQAAALADETAMGELDQATRARLRQQLPRLAEMCAELSGCGVPQTLVHGDLYLGNVAGTAERPVIFDWTDACLAHPFVDLISIFDEQDAGVQAQLRDAYLELWADYAPAEQLQRAWALAQPLSDLHRSISYHYVMVGLEPAARADFAGATTYYVQRLLGAL